MKVRSEFCLVFLLLALVSSTLSAQSLHTLTDIELDIPGLELKLDGWHAWKGQRSQRTEVVRWGSWPGVRRNQAVWLQDGSWLCGDLEFQADSIVVHSDWFESVELPLKALRGVVISPRNSLNDWTSLSSQMRAAEGTDDRILLQSGEALSGIVAFQFDGLDEPKLAVTSGTTELDFNMEEVQAVVFSPALAGTLPRKREGETIGVSDGSLLHTEQPILADNHFSLKTDSGLKLISIDSARRFSEEVVFLRRWPESVRYVSELPLAQYRYLSSESRLEWELGRDIDCLSRPLAVEQGLVDKGLAMHASSQAAFRWDGSAATLLSELCFARPPQGANPRLGSVVCKILLIRDGELKEVARVDLNRQTHPRDSARVNLEGAQAFVLLTEEGSRGQLGDHVLWLDARVLSN